MKQYGTAYTISLRWNLILGETKDRYTEAAIIIKK